MHVNTYVTGNQYVPAVEGDGDFGVAWTSVAKDRSGLGVFGQRGGLDRCDAGSILS
jgi:hypothetical protein